MGMEMNTQPELWDIIESSIAKSDESADYDWKLAAADSLERVAKSKAELTADDVLELMESRHPDVTTHNLAALGPIFLRAQKAGLIENTNRIVQSRIPRRHRKITVWASRVYRGATP
jgi:hypothetical protein